MACFPEKFPVVPIPGEISRFLEQFWLCPETAFVRVVTPCQGGGGGGVQLLLVASCYRNHRTYFTVKENSSPAPPVMLTWQYFGSSQDSGTYSEQENSVNPVNPPPPTPQPPPRLNLLQVWVVLKMGNTIHWINHNLADSMVWCLKTYPLDSDLSGPSCSKAG